MITEKKALVAFHDDMQMNMCTRLFEAEGYQVSKAESISDMLEAMGINKDRALDVPPTNYFEKYLMDANLGYQGQNTYDPAEEIFQHIKTDYESGKVKFLPITGNADLIDDAKQKNRPCGCKSKFDEILDFIKS